MTSKTTFNFSIHLRRKKRPKMNKDVYLKIRSELSFEPVRGSLWSHFAIDGLLLAGIYGLFQLSSYWSLLAAIPFAILMTRNVSFMHEAVHGTAHPHSKLNYFAGLLAGSICFLPFFLWKQIHLEHHFWAGNFNKDPALEIIKRYPRFSKAQKAFLEIIWKTRIPVTSFGQYIVFWAHSAVKLKKSAKDPMIWLNLLMPIVFWGVIALNMNGIQFLSLAAGIVMHLMIFEFLNFPHHVGLYLEDSPTAKLPVWQQYLVTRTSLYQGWFERFLVLNFNYHAEHHVFPDLPWQQLPKAHALMQASTARTETTVVHHEWLTEKRQKGFGEFLRPDLDAEIHKKKAA